MSVREDFEPQFGWTVLSPWWQQGRFVVPAFSPKDIRQVITQPALQSVLDYESPELVDRLMQEISQAPGALPLLSFTLSELYHAYLTSGREDRALRLEDYEALGGVIGALRTKIEHIYTQASPAQQVSMRHLILRRIALEGGDMSARRVNLSELKLEKETETQEILYMAQRLVEARLLIQATDEQGNTYVAAAHDALVRAWPRLWMWIKEIGEDQLLLLNQLRIAVQHYQATDKSNINQSEILIQPSLLWDKNPRLDHVQFLYEQAPLLFNKAESHFIQESQALRQQIIERLTRERDHAMSVAMASKALHLLNTDTTIAIRIAEAAYHHCSPPSQESKEALLQIFSELDKRPAYRMTFSGHRNFVNDLALSTDGQFILSGSSDHSARLWNLDGEEHFKIDSDTKSIQTVAFGREGQRIYTGGKDTCIRVWNLDGKMLRCLEGHEGEVLTLACSVDGRFLASGGSDKAVMLWDLESYTSQTFTGHYSDVMAVAFSSDSRWLVSGGQDTTIRLWTRDGICHLCIEDNDSPITSISFSADGQSILSGSIDAMIRHWSLDGQLVELQEPIQRK